MEPSKKSPSATSEDEAAKLDCEKNRGGVWLKGQCITQGTVTLKIFKGSPCQGDLITRIVMASNPAELQTLAKVALNE
jgi:hypothetical protein